MQSERQTLGWTLQRLLTLQLNKHMLLTVVLKSLGYCSLILSHKFKAFESNVSLMWSYNRLTANSICTSFVNQTRVV